MDAGVGFSFDAVSALKPSSEVVERRRPVATTPARMPVLTPVRSLEDLVPSLGGGGVAAGGGGGLGAEGLGAGGGVGVALGFGAGLALGSGLGLGGAFFATFLAGAGAGAKAGSGSGAGGAFALASRCAFK